jgi:dihydroorotase
LETYNVFTRFLDLYDLLIKGGMVVDPSNGIHEKRDIGVLRGFIESVEKDISSDQSRKTIDATGLVVTPGLIDMHVHVYPGVTHLGIDADTHSLAHGVTTVLDAGSSGSETFEGFRRYVVNVSATRIYALLNISSMGQLSQTVGELEEIRWANVEKAIEVIETNRDIIQGVKVRLGENIVGKNGIYPLHLARRVADAVKMPLMVHPQTNPNIKMRDILAELKDRDILTHSFHGRVNGIIDDQGYVLDEVKEGIKKGVVLDVGHGQGSFNFDVAQRAMNQGVKPETISSDLHHYNVFGPVYSLATTVSKFLLLGLTLDEALEKVTSKPSKLLGIDEKLGNLRKGSIADISIFELIEGSFSFEDSDGKILIGKKMLKPTTVIKDGRTYTSRLRQHSK